jgi:hypothetical protein
MIRIRLALAILLGLVLVPAVGYSQTPIDAPTQDLVSALAASWGQWPIFVGIAVALLVRAAQVARPVWWEQVPSRWRPLVGVALAGLPAFALALVTGSTWPGSVVAMVTAWITAAGSADALRLALGKVEAQ